MNDAVSDRPSIAFVGDDITADGDWQAWFPGYQTHNCGVASSTTADALATLVDVVELRPDSVALLIGGNDLTARKSVEHLVRNIELLLVTARRDLPGARMLVQSIIPRSRELAEPLRDANRHLRQFSPSVGAQYLDLWPALADAEGAIGAEFSDDGVHLTAAGYEAWLAELRPAIERLEGLPPMSRPISIISEPMDRR